MRHIFLFFTAVATLLIVSSCKQNKTSETTVNEQIQEMVKANFIVTAEDSAAVLTQVEIFLNNLKSEQYDAAVDMLYYLQGDSILKLSAERASVQKSLLKRLHGKEYELEEYRFKEETDNLVIYGVYFDVDSTRTRKQPDMTFSLNPVRRDGQWFLTLVDSKSSKVSSELHK